MNEKVVIERIKRLMTERSMKSSELTNRCGWIDSKTSKILNGKQSITIDDIDAIGNALKINPAALISPNMGDVNNYNKEIIPLNRIFKNIYSEGSDENVLADLLENEMSATIGQYLSIKDSGRIIKTYTKTKRMRNGEPDIVTIPRVLVTDNNKGQLFANELTIGYWFSENREEVYLALHYMIDESSYRYLLQGKDRIKAYSTVVMINEFFKSDRDRARMDLGNSSESKRFNEGTIICKRYELNKPYSEEDLKQELISYYDSYDSLLNSIIVRLKKEIIERETNHYLHDFTIITEDGNADTIERIYSSDKYSVRPMSVKSANRSIELALKRENHMCELDSKHDTFIDNTGEPYMEPYRLIPLTAQKEFGKSLNIEENLCCLCPMCRAKIEHAQDSEKQEMLMKLYLKHKDPLKKAGIEVSPLQLFKIYGMS